MNTHSGSGADGVPSQTAPNITVATSPAELYDIQARPGSDTCAVDAEVEYNRGIYGRTMYNPYGSARDTLIGFSSGSRNLRFGDGVGEAPPAQVDESSLLRHGYGWNPRGKNQLKTRTYQAPADLSAANIDKVPDEAGIMWGDSTFDRHSALSGVTIDRFEPLLPDLEKEVQNADHIVPTAWVRGGQDTRTQTRTLSYVGDRGFAQGGAGLQGVAGGPGGMPGGPGGMPGGAGGGLGSIQGGAGGGAGFGGSPGGSPGGRESTAWVLPRPGSL
jgi:hypothetical protein